MLSGDFIAALRILNPKLRVFSLGDNARAAGIYYLDASGAYEDVCAIDKNEIPEFPVFDENGRLAKVGWRRAVFILLQNRLTTTRRIRRVWPGFFLRRTPTYRPATRPGLDRTMPADELLAVAEDLRAKDSPQVQEKREHDRWFLKTWQKNGGNAADKPVY